MLVYLFSWRLRLALDSVYGPNCQPLDDEIVESWSMCFRSELVSIILINIYLSPPPLSHINYPAPIPTPLRY
jgi:hypothetical protein